MQLTYVETMKCWELQKDDIDLYSWEVEIIDVKTADTIPI